MRYPHFGLILSSILLLIQGPGCGPPTLPSASYFGEWRTRGGNFERSGAINASLTLPLEETWRARAGRGLLGSAVPVGSLVIVSTTDGKIKAYSVEDGERIWQTKIKGGFSAAPVVSGGKVYVSSEYPDGTLYCLDIRRGKILWKRGIGPSRSTSTIEGGVIYTVNNAGVLFAHNMATGDLLWKSDDGAFNPQSPIVRGDSLFASSGRGTLAVLSTVDGAVLEDIPLPSHPYPDLILFGRHLYFGSDTGIGVISATRNSEPGEGIELSRVYKLAVSGDVILVSDGVREITLWDIRSREIRWSRTTAGLVEAAPVILGDMGVIVTLAGEISVLGTENGELLWETHLEASLSSPPTFTGNHLLVTTERGDLVAFSSAPNPAEAAAGRYE